MNINTSYSLSGMFSAQNRLNTSAQKIAETASVGGSAESAQNVDQTLTNNLVYQLQAKNDFMASVSVFKAQDEIMGTLLDIRA